MSGLHACTQHISNEVYAIWLFKELSYKICACNELSPCTKINKNIEINYYFHIVCDGDCVWAVQHVWNSHQLFLRNQHQSIPKCNVTTNQGKEEIYLEKEKKLFRKEKDILKLQFTVKDKDETIDKLVSLLKEKGNVVCCFYNFLMSLFNQNYK